jgi:HTH-type transcriptional regulator, transcriptional repressor of NAD biosynthesis genes
VASATRTRPRLRTPTAAAWAEETIRLLDVRPDVAFTSERYGARWAKELGCAHVMVDRRRSAVPISATRIRRDPASNLAHLSGGARARYVKRVCLLGAESTGRTTLGRSLAERYGTVWNPEYGHVYSWYRGRDATDWASWTTAELVQVAQLQNWYEDFLAGLADRVLFCDTNAWTAGLFHEVYLGARSTEIDALAGRRYDLYVVCDVETPFAQDEAGSRTDGPHRRRMHEDYLAHVRSTGAPYLVVSGSHAERLAAASAAVAVLLRPAGNGARARGARPAPARAAGGRRPGRSPWRRRAPARATPPGPGTTG